MRLETGETPDDGLLHLRDREQTFRFTDIPARPVPSLLRGYSAPVKLTTGLTDEDLRFLMANDADPFNRWQAGQSYAINLLMRAVSDIRGGSDPSPATEFANALGATISDETLEPAYRAEVLNLPSETDVAREIGKDVDPQAIHQARSALREDVAKTLRATLVDLYEGHEPAGPYSPDAASAGKRALRNRALSLLAETPARQAISAALPSTTAAPRT